MKNRHVGGVKIAAYLLPLLIVLTLALVLSVMLSSSFKIRFSVGPEDIWASAFVRLPLFPRDILMISRTWKRKAVKFADLFAHVILNFIKREKNLFSEKPFLENSQTCNHLVSQVRNKMSLDRLSLLGKAGLDDAQETALLCGAFTAAGGIIKASNPTRRGWKILFVPVYGRAYFALKGELVVRVSLFNVAKLMILAKRSLSAG